LRYALYDDPSPGRPPRARRRNPTNGSLGAAYARPDFISPHESSPGRPATTRSPDGDLASRGRPRTRTHQLSMCGHGSRSFCSLRNEWHAPRRYVLYPISTTRVKREPFLCSSAPAGACGPAATRTVNVPHPICACQGRDAHRPGRYLTRLCDIPRGLLTDDIALVIECLPAACAAKGP